MSGAVKNEADVRFVIELLGLNYDRAVNRRGLLEKTRLMRPAGDEFWNSPTSKMLRPAETTDTTPGS
jgi:hypothetical protein